MVSRTKVVQRMKAVQYTQEKVITIIPWTTRRRLYLISRWITASNAVSSSNTSHQKLKNLRNKNSTSL